MTEVIEHLIPIVESAAAPVIADADTGYGNALNVHRTVRAFERIGVAAIHLEDQTFPKRCGHLDDKTVVSTAEMVQKLRAARDAVTDPDFIASHRRARGGRGCGHRRAHAYAEAGAEVVLVEAPETMAQIEAIASRCPIRSLITCSRAARRRRAGSRGSGARVCIVIIPSDLQRAAIRAMEDVLGAIERDGHSAALVDRMATFKEREEIVETRSFLERDRRYATTAAPRQRRDSS
jgi:2-methylisocitrate lyase-like PEP mutase family enzyme